MFFPMILNQHIFILSLRTCVFSCMSLCIQLFVIVKVLALLNRSSVNSINRMEEFLVEYNSFLTGSLSFTLCNRSF